MIDGSLGSPCRALLSVIELLFLSLTAESLQGKTCQNALLFGGVGQFELRFHILLSDSANCTVLRSVLLPQFRRVTDRQTDGQTDRRTELL